MVRLRGQCLNGFHVDVMFQFQYGAIKRRTEVANIEYALRFNSNMVRLRAYWFIFYPITQKKFQFQYGAIKSIRLLNANLIAIRFQFQYGAIKRERLL